MSVGVKTGPFDDRRPWFAVTVTGHVDVIPAGVWMHAGTDRDDFTRPGAPQVRSYLDAVLWRRRESHRVIVYCRGDGAGIDCVVRAYCELRKVPCVPVRGEYDVWGREASYRRDLVLLARSAAVVWFGPRDTDPTADPDLVTLAICLGIPYRVVPLGTLTAEPGGTPNGISISTGIGETRPPERGGPDR